MKQSKRLKRLNILTKPYTTFRRRGRLVQLLLVALLVCGIAQLIFDGWSYRAYQASVARNDNDRLVMMLTDAIHDVSKPVVIDPTSKKVYMPDASIVLPPYPDGVREVRYAYSGDKGPHAMEVTTDDAIQSGNAKVLATRPSDDSTAIFSKVPNAQACARGLTVTLNGPAGERDDSAIVYSKLLTDGREMDIYEQNTCQGYDFRPLIDYLKKADSY